MTPGIHLCKPFDIIGSRKRGQDDIFQLGVSDLPDSGGFNELLLSERRSFSGSSPVGLLTHLGEDLLVKPEEILSLCVLRWRSRFCPVPTGWFLRGIQGCRYALSAFWVTDCVIVFRRVAVVETAFRRLTGSFSSVPEILGNQPGVRKSAAPAGAAWREKRPGR